jgi:hypothetical protein
MKFMVNWSVDQDKWLPILEQRGSMTADQHVDAGPGVSIVGQWQDTGRRTGVAIIEASDLSALSTHLGQWNPHMDMDVTPVLDDEEAAVVARALTDGGEG